MRRSRETNRRRARGVSLVELVVTFLILAFVSLGTIQLYRVGDKTQRTARFYTDAQAKTRTALQRICRSVRHASGAVVGSSESNFSAAPNSSATQIIVTVPQSYPNTGWDHIRIYLSSGTVYAQRQDDTGAGLALATGVTALTFSYFLTTTASSGSTTTSVDGAPATANAVQIALTLKSGTVTTTETAFVSLRNRNLGF